MSKASLRHVLCLLFTILIAAGWNFTAFCADNTQSMNASGNRNLGLSVDPSMETDGYTAVLYDNRNGLPTSEANAIAQTPEGFLWIGSYAGLICCDGRTFERVDGISNVRCLFVDTRSRLWIGTNDSGVYLMKEGETQKWDKSDGLKSVSIRCIAENTDGLLYIGTAVGVAMIDRGLQLTVLEDERISDKQIHDIRRGRDGMIYGSTIDGDLFTLRDGAVVSYMNAKDCPVSGINCILPDPKLSGYLYIGNGESRIYHGSMNDDFQTMESFDISPLSYPESFEWIDGGLWICTGNGIGKMDEDGIHPLSNVPMNNSVGHVMTDYEGHLWFTSTRQGVMKIVKNQFADLFLRLKLPDAVVNTTCMSGRRLFIGTDDGLIVAEGEKTVEHLPLKKAVTAGGKDLGVTDLLEYLKGSRIRSIIRDTAGRLWISTWRKNGLVMYDKEEIVSFTPEDGLFSDLVRTVFECEDGSILVSNMGGVNVIRDERVAGGYGEEEGITNESVLTMTEGFSHELIFGSDGDGIFVIKDDETMHLGTDDGLSSEVILRIKKSKKEDIYWIVTSNSLAYMTPDFQVTTIRQFPYSNNYDLYENDKGDAWVLSSNGIYVVSVKELLQNEQIDPIFYGVQSGLPCIATANSFSELTDDNDLYIAGSSSVVKVNIEKSFANLSQLKITVPYIDADNVRIYANSDGNFTMPGNVHKLTFHPYVFSYSLIDPVISYRLEGFEKTDNHIRRSALTPVGYTNVPNGTYHFIMVVREPVGHSARLMSFRIDKGKVFSYGTAGTLIMDAASLFFMCGILIYTAIYRKRGRLDDRLFFCMVVSNILLTISDGIAYWLEGLSNPYIVAIMTTCNMVFFFMFALFPYLFLLYLDYRVYRSKQRLRMRKIICFIPCLILLLLLFANLKTGWLFTFTEDGIYHSGSLNNLVFVPAVLYFLTSEILVAKISKRLVLLGLLLIAVRLAWGIWFRDISSTSFTYTMFLVCTHIHVMNRPLDEEDL